MRKAFLISIMLLFSITSFSYAGFFENLINKDKSSSTGDAQSEGGAKEDTGGSIISGLKEALSIGTGNAVVDVSKTDGYFANEAIKILAPKGIQNVIQTLKKVGFQKEVDAFTLSMNRAAEKAAPQAKSIFLGAIKGMSFRDANKILNGGDTAATEYLKSKTSSQILKAFKPIITSAMDEVGVTRNYKDMMKIFTSLPFTKSKKLDLDQYVAGKAMDGLFYMVGEEEKKIRTNPAARVTGLLQQVFGR